METFYAHSSDDQEKAWQTLIDHLTSTASIAADFASVFQASDWGYICGLLHDLGKYSKDFQKKLEGKTIRVDHSTAGAKEAITILGSAIGKLIAYCVAGHHAGLPNYGTFARIEGTLADRLAKTISDYSAYRDEIQIDSNRFMKPLPLRQTDDHLGFSISFFIRMLYSCLVDADYLDTERFMSDLSKLRSNHSDVQALLTSLDAKLDSIKDLNTSINLKRSRILERCVQMADGETRFYTLTVPTGGGKTYSSLSFALNHAVINDLKRVIYVMPYTSIIEQNADVFRDALGLQNVLEHHSNYLFEKENPEDSQDALLKLKLASENWDIPVTVTTNVQFFESMFANRSSKCRKLHNLAKSVIILDEAQMLPINYLSPCMLGLSELVKNYNSTVVLCTATQPEITKLLPQGSEVVEIMEDPLALYEDFKKVKVIHIGEATDEGLSRMIRDEFQVLCIVNTRRHAKAIFELVMNEDAFHLSTLMCPMHRKETLTEIKRRLEEGLPCRVVSTQLIEAGVDIDFPIVFRSMAGVDSIVQTAGRCNREGKLKEGKVFLFQPLSEFSRIRGYLERTAKIAEMVIRDHEDPISLAAIKSYFDILYDVEGEDELDKKEILRRLEERHKSLEFDFKDIAEDFKLIDHENWPIVIPYDAAANALIDESGFVINPKTVARKLQPYTVGVYEKEYETLMKIGVLKVVDGLFAVLTEPERHYSRKLGLLIPGVTFGEAILA